ncbi:Acetoacetyl-CoA synthetase, partial [hydrothermal vent metagenome]
NLAGIKVSSVQIEELLVQHEALQEAAAISVSPSGGGPSLLIIFAVLHTKIDSQMLQTELQKIIKDQLNPLFKIHAVELIEQLPRTASHKVMHRKLRDVYLRKN